MKKSNKKLPNILKIILLILLSSKLEADRRIVYSDQKVTVYRNENRNEFHVKCNVLIMDHYQVKPRIPIYRGRECELRASELIEKKIEHAETLWNRLIFPINSKNTKAEVTQFLEFYAQSLLSGVDLEEASDGDNLYGYLTVRYYFMMNDQKHVFQFIVNGKSINKTETNEKNLVNMRFLPTRFIQMSVYRKPQPSNWPPK